ncbi:MAG: amylo-alpha-1,6-glucosidase [Chloroflexota bacterium]|nr:MAG: amylo-alpha-1,6-glucosidase [Chloroflexota bacterium]
MLTGAVALKENDLQFISNEAGDVPRENQGGLGLYFRDTRFLSQFELSVNGIKPLFLSNSVNKHYIATFQFINPPLVLADGKKVKQQTISIRRSRFVCETGLYERIGLLNCNHFPVRLDIVLALDADFKDIFAVRGFKTQRVAGQISVDFGRGDLVFSYRGRDHVLRTSRCAFTRHPEAISAREVRFSLSLEPQESESIVVHVQPAIDEVPDTAPSFDSGLEGLAASYAEWDQASTRISTDNELFDRELLRASRYDIRTLLERTPQGLVPDAGIPWYAVPFGRDAIITALQTLLYNPSIAEGTLRFLAAYQGRVTDNEREEQPGKIMHEVRRGELARLREVPHTPYYGTIDATPLFLVLFVEAMAWIDCDRLYADLTPAVEKALEWIDRFGDVDGDGYVEYVAHRPGGVMNHGWKDSVNAVQLPDGSNATQPIALVEVQGYVYHAKTGLAALLRRRGRHEAATRLEIEACILKERFNRDFWMEEDGFYALALDGAKDQVRSVSSNAGHSLWSGICDDDKATLVAERLLAPDMFSGWGVRTLSRDSPNYNPMSYHNGSVWPHDTAIIAMGLRRVGHTEAALQLVKSLLEAGSRFSDGRLPELFCGFARDQRFNSSPAAYIVSCSPQAWAAGCVFMLIHCLLDPHPDIAAGRLQVSPALPDVFHSMTLANVRFGTERLQLSIKRSGDDIDVALDGPDRVRLMVDDRF